MDTASGKQEHVATHRCSTHVDALVVIMFRGQRSAQRSDEAGQTAVGQLNRFLVALYHGHLQSQRTIFVAVAEVTIEAISLKR